MLFHHDYFFCSVDGHVQRGKALLTVQDGRDDLGAGDRRLGGVWVAALVIVVTRS